MKRNFRRWSVEYLEDRYLLASDIVINEFLASNQNGLRDADGDTSDWIELLNTGPDTVSLDRYYLTDDEGDLAKWRLPSIPLAAGETLVVFASGKDRTDAESELHTNFKLAADGEFLALVDADRSLIASGYVPSYPPQTADVSYGLSLDRTFSQYFATPTPGASPTGGTSGSSSVVISEIMYHPASEDAGDEYLELYNAGAIPVALAGWGLVDGVEYVLPDYTLASGETLVVAADVQQFRETYGVRDNLVGGWTGKLSDRGEPIELVRPDGTLVDRVEYSDEGDWAIRIRGELDRNHQGWVWSDAHDGQGKSLELINPALDNNIGQNWSVSTAIGGTPGTRNSVHASDTAPLIDRVSHYPPIPRSTDDVLVQARVHDEQASVSVELYWRNDGQSGFQMAEMFDDGTHGDVSASDGVYVASIPAQADRSVVEFYVLATDLSLQHRQYPNVEANALEAPNLLYQVDDAFAEERKQVAKGDGYAQPIFRLVMTEAERAELSSIGSGRDADSNAQMNGTFVSFDGSDVDVRYNVGIRNRGKSSRDNPPNNYRVNFANDQIWNQARGINLNSKQPFAQVLGSVFFRAAGVITADATAVQVRVNGQDLSAGDPSMFGAYNYLEIIDGDFAAHHFPLDGNGNAYTGVWIGGNQADLRDEGNNPDAYRDRYSKNTNETEDDWSDLLQLIDVLNNAPLNTLLEQVEQLADVDQWLRYLATDTLMVNRETSPANGIGDDYRMYRGQNQQRFVFVPHDLDSILGVTDQRVDFDIWLPAEMDGLRRLLSLPEVAQRYYATLLELADSVFHQDQAAVTIDHVLGSWVPEQTRQRLLQFIDDRVTHVRTQIPTALTVTTSLNEENGLPRTSSSTVVLSGVAPAAATVVVEVNGLPADYDVQSASWSVPVAVVPGLNRFEVKAIARDGSTSAVASIDVFRDPSGSTDVSGTLTEDAIWTSDRTRQVVEDLVIPAGVTLQVEPGTLVKVADGVSIRVEGQLVATGEVGQPIRFTRLSSSGAWNGLLFVNTQEENLLRYVDLAFSDGNDESILVDHARLDLDGVRWLETTGTSLEVSHPTLTVRNSVFPSVVDNETIHGSGLDGSERFVLEGNTFGTTTGYSDIIDFSGGQRPGPVLEVIGNVFNGGTDDGLDLDGTDAYIAGNLFRHIHKDNSSDSSSNAIATGVDSGNASELVIVGNIFYDVDNALLLKERSSAIFEHNLVVQATLAGINMDEPNRDVDPGAAIQIRNSVFWQTDTVLNNIAPDPEFGVPDIQIDYSLLPTVWHGFGVGNATGDPGIAEYEFLTLRDDSPANDVGPYGSQIGAQTPLLTAQISGEPSSLTVSPKATLHVFGPDVQSYRYRLAGTGQPWSAIVSVAEPIQLQGLTAGTYAIEVVGIDSRGISQPESQASRSRSWTVVEEQLPIMISEVYASSDGGSQELASDWIELYNPNLTPVDLTSYSLSNDPAEPRRFVFPAGTQLGPDQYLQLPSIDEQDAVATGLQFSDNGDAVFLYQSTDAQTEIVDQVVFGLQIPGYSIGRIGSEQSWRLTKPTPSAVNQLQPTGTLEQVTINEWFTSGDVRLADDFLELANADSLPVDLSGLHLSDHPGSWPDRHVIADLSYIEPQGYRVFVADGDTTAAADHLSFRLSRETAQIGLFDTNQDLLDVVQYATQQTDISEGRTPDDGVARFVLPTPGLPNGETSRTVVEALDLVMWSDRWRYDASGNDLGTAWQSPSFDDSDWLQGAGPFGLESSSLSVPIETPLSLGPITYYFRSTFEFAGDPNITELYLQTQLDDGAVFYLNGTEIVRSNMPTGEIDSQTRASNAVGNARIVDLGQRSVTSLVPGTNVLAVEVHQASSSSSDIVFAMTATASVTQVVEPDASDDLRLLQGLRLTELMYHPANDAELEFVELANVSDRTLALAGVRLAGGIDFEFPESSLAAGETVVVAKNLVAFQQEYGNQIRVIGEYTRSLSNGGEEASSWSCHFRRRWRFIVSITATRVHRDGLPQPTGRGIRSRSSMCMATTAPRRTGELVRKWEARLVVRSACCREGTSMVMVALTPKTSIASSLPSWNRM